MERTNFRTVDSLPEPARIATVDVSFISLRLILPAVARVIAGHGDAIVLVKPQFEAGKGKVGKGGVVRDTAIHREVLEAFAGSAAATGWTVMNMISSPLLGRAGNREFLAHLRRGSEAALPPDQLVSGALEARIS
jgi:23S rRNA (cytidine1920-2'-O)/16S rRNA (cytidine1409-2'-O)-methyltransferase